MDRLSLQVRLEPAPTTIAGALHAVLGHTDKDELSLSEVMGYTSHAFRINLRAKSIETDSIHSFHGGQALGLNLTALGFKSLNLCPPVKSITPDILQDIIRTISGSIRRGSPVIGWDLFDKNFGVIYGFDDEKQVLYAKDGKTDGTIPYEQLPNRRILCLAAVQESLHTNRLDMLKKALEAILDHARGRDGLSFPNVASGLQCYDTWMEALQAGDKISNKGNALNLHIVADARRHSVAFLNGLAEQFEADIGRLAAAASGHYSRVVEQFEELERIYPYPVTKSSVSPRERKHLPLVLELLGKAKEAERQGVAVLEEMYAGINGQVYQGV